MTNIPPELQKIFSSPEARKLFAQKDALQSLSNSPQVQKLMQVLQQKSGGDLQGVAQAAMQGDASQLTRLLDDVTRNPETAKTIADISRQLQK